MKSSACPSASLPPYAAAALQAVADGFTEEDAATYLGCDVETVDEALKVAQLSLGANSLEHAVALAMGCGAIV